MSSPNNQYTDEIDPSICDVCDTNIEPLTGNGFSLFARQVGAYLDHLSENHPDHYLLEERGRYL